MWMKFCATMSGNKVKIFLMAALLLFFAGCFNKNEPQIYGRESLDQVQLNIMFIKQFGFVPNMPDKEYQTVNYDSLQFFYNEYKSELSSKGISKWNESFDCNRYSLFYHAFAQVFYFQQSGDSKAPSIAIGELYYFSKRRSGHAINFAVTERGIVFIEPQTGKIVELNRAEIDNIIYVKM